MYQDDNQIIFTTLVIGEKYRNIISTQIQSILKFTNHRLVVITDDVAYFGNYYGSRVSFVPFQGLTQLPIRGSKYNLFNYNLKLVPIKYVFDTFNPDMVIYMDADTWLFGWNRQFYRAFDPYSYGVYGRFRHPLNDPGANVVIASKLNEMGIDASQITTQVPIEAVMFWKNGKQINSCLKQWEHYAQIACDTSRTDFEAIELSLGLYHSQCPYHNIASDQRYNIEDFRTLHNGSIHIPFIL